MSKSKTDKLDRFFEMLAGEFIQVVLDKDVESSVQTEKTVSINKTPLIVEGYLVEEDDVYVFLGQQPNTITQAIRKEYIIHIQVTSEENSMFNQIDTDVGPLPKDSKGYN
jgi:hypothetical protein